MLNYDNWENIIIQMEMFKLFGLISTKELYLLKLDVVAKFQYTSYFNDNYTLAFNPKYV